MLGVDYLAVCDQAQGLGAEMSPQAAAGIRAVLDGQQEDFLLTYPCHTPDQRRWFTMRVRSLANEAGRLVLVGHQDVSDLAGAEQVAGARLREMVDESPMLVWMADPDGLCTFFNRTWLAFTGRSLEQELGEGWTEGLHPRDRRRVVEQYREALAARRPFELEYRLRRADGQHRWVLDRGAPRFDLEGGFAGYLGSCLDIGDRKEKERAVREGREVARALMDAVTHAALLIDPQGRVLACNQALANRFGSSPELLIGRSYTDFTPEALLASRAQKIAQVLATGQPMRFEEDRGGMLLANSFRPIFDDQGRVKTLAIFSEDITARRRAEESLRESEEKYRLLFASSLDGVFLTTPEGGILAANPAACQMFGYSEDELKNLGRAGILDAGDPRLADFLERRLREGFARGVLTGRRKDGALFPLEASSQIFVGPGGQRMTSMINRDLTQVKAAQEELRQSEQRYRTLFEKAADGIFLMEAEGEQAFLIIAANPAAAAMHGCTVEEIIGKRMTDLDTPAARQRAPEHLRRAMAGQWIRAEAEHLRQDGSVFPVEFQAGVVELDGRRLILAFDRDVSERRRAEEQLKLAMKAFENTIEGVMVTDAEGKVQMVNPAFTAITGFCAEEVLGREPVIFRAEEFAPEFYERLWQDLTEKGQWSGEIVNRRKDGRSYPEWVTVSIVRDAQGRVSNYLAVFYDITEIRSGEEKIRYQAYHDMLTGLPNRLLFNDRLELALARAIRHKESVGVVFLDLDHFKHINDSLGHAIGDLLLQGVASRLKALVRDEDTVARLGGDEFILLVPGLAGAEDAAQLASRIQLALERPFRLRGRELYVTASLGLTLFPDDGGDLDTLVKNADLAMYRAKEEGRNTFQMFTSSLQVKARERLRLEGQLRKGLERGEFLPFYQPVLEMASGRVVGMEALARWRRHGRVIAPNQFIPLAEETGLIVKLGERLLEMACRQTAKWRAQGFGQLKVAVNLSARQFQQQDLLEMVRSVLERTGLPPEGLELEITESTVMANVAQAAQILKSLAAMGVRLGLDDFGTGYSSLYYLKQFPISTLKIDRSFIMDIPDDPDDMAIAQAVISLARSLGLKVVAEGVETPAQLGFLRSQGCDYLQGYIFRPPLAAAHMENLLRQGLRLEITDPAASVENTPD
jgi:diguanylate cyclase (GGDEF)-like protein/PAS domain S-box-containing protein